MAESCLRYFSHMGIFLTESVRVGIVKEKKLLSVSYTHLTLPTIA